MKNAFVLLFASFLFFSCQDQYDEKKALQEIYNNSSRDSVIVSKRIPSEDLKATLAYSCIDPLADFEIFTKREITSFVFLITVKRIEEDFDSTNIATLAGKRITGYEVIKFQPFIKNVNQLEQVESGWETSEKAKNTEYSCILKFPLGVDWGARQMNNDSLFLTVGDELINPLFTKGSIGSYATPKDKVKSYPLNTFIPLFTSNLSFKENEETAVYGKARMRIVYVSFDMEEKENCYHTLKTETFRAWVGGGSITPMPFIQVE